MSDTEQSKEINTYETAVCKARELIDWIGHNDENYPGTYADCIDTDILIAKIKELFEV